MLFRSSSHELDSAERAQRVWSGAQLSEQYRLAHPRIETRFGAVAGMLRLRSWLAKLLTGCAGLLFVALVLVLIPTGKVVVAPGKLVSATEIIRVEDPSLATPTVSAVVVNRRDARLFDVVRNQLGGHLRIETDVDSTTRVIRHLGDEILRSSFAQARYAALRELHVDAKFTASRVVFTDVRPNTPLARAGVRTNDNVTAVNGMPVNNGYDFVRLLGTASRSEPVELSLGGGRSARLQLPSKDAVPKFNQVELVRRLGSTILSIGAAVETDDTHTAVFLPSFEGGSAGLAIGAATLQAAGIGRNAPPFVATGALYPDGSVNTVADVAAKSDGIATSGVQFLLVSRFDLADTESARSAGVTVVPIDNLSDVAAWLHRYDDTPTAAPRKDAR